jgi:hypothetical protein
MPTIPLFAHLLARRFYRPLVQLLSWFMAPLIRHHLFTKPLLRLHVMLARRAGQARCVQLFGHSSLAYDLAAVGPHDVRPRQRLLPPPDAFGHGPAVALADRRRRAPARPPGSPDASARHCPPPFVGSRCHPFLAHRQLAGRLGLAPDLQNRLGGWFPGSVRPLPILARREHRRPLHLHRQRARPALPRGDAARRQWPGWPRPDLRGCVRPRAWLCARRHRRAGPAPRIQSAVPPALERPRTAAQARLSAPGAARPPPRPPARRRGPAPRASRPRPAGHLPPEQPH